MPVLLPAPGASAASPAAWSFAAGSSPIYHLRTMQAQAGARAVVTASLDGTTACFSPEGRPLWSAPGSGGFPFDLAAADIDGDGRDEVLVASGDGALYVYDAHGAVRWKFARTAPLYQVCVARDRGGNAIILTGGVEQVLYALSPEGAVLHQLKTEHCIRNLRTGNVLGTGEDSLAMATTSSGLNGKLTLFLLNVGDLSIRWQKTGFRIREETPTRRFFSMLVCDLDKDGKDEVVMGGGHEEHGAIYAFDGKGELLFSNSDRKIPRIPYRMNLLRKITLPREEFILGHFGHLLALYDMKGRVMETLAGPYSFADSCFDPELKTLFMGSAVSGGTEIYAYRLDQPGWKQAYQTQRAQGRLKEIEDNLAILGRQVREFKAPAYQPAPRPTLAITRIKDPTDYQHVAFARSITLTQKVDDPAELWCRDLDRRMPYRHTANELVKIITDHESRGENTLIWSGHGDAIYFPLSTFERLMRAGPKHLKGFVFAEMEGTNEQTQEVVEKIILPLAELCRQHGKIIFFRNKNIFWNGTCYLPFWSKVLFNEKYRDVFVPALEETNCRTQELSLAGRVGLWQAGYFKHWACRSVTDEANFSRMFEWGGHQLVTHHLRTLVSTAAMGADVFLSDIHAGPRTEALFEQLVPFYAMLEKGILQLPRPDQLLSCSDFALVMRSPPSAAYLKHGVNGHGYSFPRDENPPMVFNQLDAYWAGSVLPAHDFSGYAMNVRQRTCNFLPQLPYGLVPIIPARAAKSGRFQQTIATDGEFFFDGHGAKHLAREYRPEVEKALKAAASRLPMRVEGPAHWSAARLDARHIRLTLIDPGYLDPAARQVEIVFQHFAPTKCRDILSGEPLRARDGRLAVTIPAGTFRIIDFELE